ncbi:MAG: hypothetical protein WB492_04780 [Christiangramia sp.]
MKILSKVLLLLFIGLTISCDDDKCEELICNSGPASFELELVDSETGENLFTNGTFEESDLQLNQTEGNNIGDWDFLSENDINLIRISTFNDIAYSVKVSNEEIFQIAIEAESITVDCCSSVRVDDFQVTGADFEQVAETGVYRVSLEL